MTYLLIGAILGLILGSFLGAYISTKFDVFNAQYSIEKLKAKKGGVIDVDQMNETTEQPKKEKRKLFKLNRRKKHGNIKRKLDADIIGSNGTS